MEVTTLDAWKSPSSKIYIIFKTTTKETIIENFQITTLSEISSSKNIIELGSWKPISVTFE